MTTIWVCIAATALVSFTIKAAGPALLGERPLPSWARAVFALLAPALLFALVVVAVLGPGWSAVDLSVVAGVTVAVVARLFGAPSLLAVAGAVAVVALVRVF